MRWKRAIVATSAVLALLALATSEEIEGAQDSKAVEQDVSATKEKANDSLKVGIVNFRKVVEASKQGKQQQAAFEGMKTQMESLLQDKEKSVNEIATKLQDADYMDGLTPEAENELKHKYRALGQELAQAQQQFLQTLQQANVKIVQMLSEDVAKAAGEVAKNKNLDLVFNEDAAFHYKPAIDISDLVVQKMNETFDRESKKKDTAVTDTKTETKKQK